jgi:branched-chain amino acid transport system ATP-binding protein
MTQLLKIEHLEVRYGDLIGVADVSLEVPKGSVVALLGSNGAGKTTTLNAVAGIVPASAGTVEFHGENIAGLPAYAIVRKGLALSPEGWRLFTQQSVENNLLLGATPLADRTRIPRLLERVYAVFPRLAERRAQRAGTMSGGERQMLAVGRALLAGPRVLMLDEPSAGLAPRLISDLLSRIRLLVDRGLPVLLVEQNVKAALKVVDHLYLLERGRIVGEGPADVMAADHRIVEAYLGSIAAGVRP